MRKARERERKDSVSRDEMHFVSEEKALILIKLLSVFFYRYIIIVGAFVLYSYIMRMKEKMRERDISS